NVSGTVDPAGTTASLNIGTLNLTSGGLLKGVGTINGSVNNGSSAAVAPGNSPGTLNITGNFTTSGILSIELGGPAITRFDRIVVSGNTIINGGTVHVQSFGGYTPTPGDGFTFIRTGGTVTVNTPLLVNLPPTGYTGMTVSPGLNFVDLLMPFSSSSSSSS